jgi:hypothetical protein
LRDHDTIEGDRHLYRFQSSYFAFYHKARPHMELGHDAPEPRPLEPPKRVTGSLRSRKWSMRRPLRTADEAKTAMKGERRDAFHSCRFGFVQQARDIFVPADWVTMLRGRVQFSRRSVAESLPSRWWAACTSALAGARESWPRPPRSPRWFGQRSCSAWRAKTDLGLAEGASLTTPPRRFRGRPL